jgi:hypothetical protein
MYLIYLCSCQWHLPFLHFKNQENCYTYYLLLVYTTDPNCSKGDIEDKKHFIVDCPLYENIRVKFFDKVIDLCPNFRYMDTSSKFVWLFTNEHECFSSSISPSEQFVHFRSDLIMFLYLPVSIFNG